MCIQFGYYWDTFGRCVWFLCSKSRGEWWIMCLNVCSVLRHGIDKSDSNYIWLCLTSFDHNYTDKKISRKGSRKHTTPHTWHISSWSYPSSLKGRYPLRFFNVRWFYWNWKRFGISVAKGSYCQRYCVRKIKNHVIKDAIADLHSMSVNSLRPSDAYMRQWNNHHWFR